MRRSSITSRIDPASVFGFILPLALALLVGFTLHAHYSKPLPNPDATSASNSTTSGTESAVAAPSGNEIAAANAAILAYCSNDLRQDTSCVLISGSNSTAPGFVESGVSESGRFEGQQTTTEGVALAKGGGLSWTVIWLGQGCVPKNIASQYMVPNSFTICAS